MNTLIPIFPNCGIKVSFAQKERKHGKKKRGQGFGNLKNVNSQRERYNDMVERSKKDVPAAALSRRRAIAIWFL